MVNRRRRVGKNFEKEVDELRKELGNDLTFPQTTEYFTPFIRELRKRKNKKVKK